MVTLNIDLYDALKEAKVSEEKGACCCDSRRRCCTDGG
jgi:hypothetical protein